MIYLSVNKTKLKNYINFYVGKLSHHIITTLVQKGV
jgi:hypothetical protein